MSSVAVKPDGKYTVLGSFDRILKVWNLQKGEIVSELTGLSLLQTLNVSPIEETLLRDALAKLLLRIWRNPIKMISETSEGI